MDRIGKESQDCLRLLNEAAALEHLGPAQQSTIADSVGRFKLWAGNIGALQQGMSAPSENHVEFKPEEFLVGDM